MAKTLRLQRIVERELLRNQVWKVEEGRLETVDSGQSTRHYSLSPDSRGWGRRPGVDITFTFAHQKSNSKHLRFYLYCAFFAPLENIENVNIWARQVEDCP